MSIKFVWTHDILWYICKSNIISFIVHESKQKKNTIFGSARTMSKVFFVYAWHNRFLLKIMLKLLIRWFWLWYSTAFHWWTTRTHRWYENKNYAFHKALQVASSSFHSISHVCCECAKRISIESNCNWLWFDPNNVDVSGIQLVFCLIYYFISKLCSFALYSRLIILKSFEKANCQTIEKLLVAVFTTLTPISNMDYCFLIKTNLTSSGVDGERTNIQIKYAKHIYVFLWIPI